MKTYFKGNLIEGVTQVEMLKSGVVSVTTISIDNEGNYLTDDSSLLMDINHYPIKDVTFDDGMVNETQMEEHPMKTCCDAPVGYTEPAPIGQWQGWNGGDCPVHPLATVEYVMLEAGKGTDTADQLDWEHSGDTWDIVAYRVVKEYREPHALWLRQGILSGEWHVCREHAPNATLFREVLE